MNDDLFLVLPAFFILIAAVLLKFGVVKPSWWWGYSALGNALMGLGFLALAVNEDLSLSEVAASVLKFLGFCLFTGGFGLYLRARKKKAPELE